MKRKPLDRNICSGQIGIAKRDGRAWLMVEDPRYVKWLADANEPPIGAMQAREANRIKKFLLVITSESDRCQTAAVTLDGQASCSDNNRTTSQEKLDHHLTD